MDFKNIPSFAQPAFTWMWNTTVTKEEIRRQIDEMYDFGARAFYVLAEPESFRPNLRRTFLKPEYMSDEYVDLVYYAYEYGKSKGMTSWLYNEGGFPSGMVCGQIREKHPELAMKKITKLTSTLSAGVPYSAPENLISAFANGKRINDGEVFSTDTEIINYFVEDENSSTTIMRTSIAERRNTDLFLELTHEKLKKRFGNVMGTDVKLMFDDEAHMGSWVNNLDKIFFERYGYDLKDYMPYIYDVKIDTETTQQAKARIDYLMLCGDLMINNYFKPMREWLNKNNMLSTGHLGGDNDTFHRHGNILSTLREYDVPGIDEIWNQITYPHEIEYRDKKLIKSCKGAYEFFPRIASSAANQLGHNRCVSETFSVSGSYLPPEEMRYILNYQAVRGISMFNYMLISFDRTGERPLQCRPNYIAENPGTTFLSRIINYTARLSHVLLSGKPKLSTAILYPQRTIAAGGKIGAKAGESFEQLGDMLEQAGVEFDIIDELFVQQAKLENGTLKGEHVTYSNVFMPEAGVFELDEVIEKISAANNDIKPSIIRTNKKIISRSILFPDGSEGLFIVNTAAEYANDSISITTDKTPYIIDLESADYYNLKHSINGDNLSFPVNLLRGEGIMILLTNEKIEAKDYSQLTEFSQIKDLKANVVRKFTVDKEKGLTNEYFTNGAEIKPFNEWDKDFSGEVEYVAELKNIPSSEFVLDLGEVRDFARIYLNDKVLGEAIMPPYRVKITGAKDGDILKILVSNTAANANRCSEYQASRDIKDIGPYNGFMTIAEQAAPCGGLIGPIKILKID